MIDNAALAVYPFRTGSFDLGGDKYHFRARVDGGVTLIQDLNVMFAGEVRKISEIEWIIQFANDDVSHSFHSRDAAIYTLLAKVAERNAEYAHNVAEFDRRTAERQAV